MWLRVIDGGYAMKPVKKGQRRVQLAERIEKTGRVDELASLLPVRQEWLLKQILGGFLTIDKAQIMAKGLKLILRCRNYIRSLFIHCLGGEDINWFDEDVHITWEW